MYLFVGCWRTLPTRMLKVIKVFLIMKDMMIGWRYNHIVDRDALFAWRWKANNWTKTVYVPRQICQIIFNHHNLFDVSLVDILITCNRSQGFGFLPNSE